MHNVGVGRRFLATLVDAVLGFAWTFPFVEIERSPGYFRAELVGNAFVAVVIITVVYYIVMEALFGATVGKFVTGIRVVRADGRRVDGVAALLRNVVRIVDFLPFAYLIGAIAVWTSPTRQRLGDRLAKTVVVVASSRGAATGTPQTGWVPPAPTSPGHGAPPPMPPPPPVSGAGPHPAPPPPADSPGPPPPADHRPVLPP